MWLADSGEKVTVLEGGHPGPTHCVQFNPKLMMMAMACNSMVSVLKFEQIVSTTSSILTFVVM